MVVTSQLYAKIIQVAQLGEAMIVREIQERNVRKNYRLTIAPGINTPTKRKETTLGKKKATKQQSNMEVNLMYPKP